MDIHRCRFVPYEASAINAVAFSHPHLSTANKHSKTTPARLAIGRANGDIEIWNPLQGAWLHETTIPGGQDRSIEGLVWVVGDDEEISDGRKTTVAHGRPRLFSIGYTNTITEWDLEKGCALRHASGQHGDIWCLVPQPKAANASSQRLVGGTMDGCLVLYATEDDDLRFQRVCRTHKKSVKIVSLAFQSRHMAVAGCSDGTIRVFDIRNGALTHAMTLGRDLAGGVKDVIVWSVRCLPNGDIVSGDSTGQICIWDGRTYTQAQRLQGHAQDVLSLAAAADGSTIVSGGMDRRVVLYREVPGGGGGEGSASRWAKVWHRRYHQHDVKTMASFEARGINVVVAGGPDAIPVVLPLQKSGMEHHRTLSHLPQAVPVASAPAARLVLSWWNRRVHVWALDAPLDQLLRGGSGEGGNSDDPELDIHRNRRLVGRILINGEANITAVAVSPDGALVVVATQVEVKAFSLQRAEDKKGPLVITKVRVPPAVAAKGASNVSISPDGRWVGLAHGAADRLTVLEVVGTAADKAGSVTICSKPTRLARLKRAIPRHELFSGLGRYERHVAHVAFSPDSRMLAVADLAGYVDTWVLRGADGTVPGLEVQEILEGATGDDVAMAEETDESDDSDSDSDAENEAEDADETETSGDTWVRNARAKQFPKLSATPVVLSFAPDVPGGPVVTGSAVAVTAAAAAAAAVNDADTGARKTRNRAATQEKKATADDYVLFVVTATSRLFAFHPLRARLVGWQRRLNPASLPVAFRNIRDLAKGVLWQGPRLWLYGMSYVFMLDTSVEGGGEDEEREEAANGARQQQQQQTPLRKRKRGDDSGAGNSMVLGRLQPARIQMAVSEEAEADDEGATSAERRGGGWVDVSMEDADDRRNTDDDDDDDDDDDSEEEEDDEEVKAKKENGTHGDANADDAGVLGKPLQQRTAAAAATLGKKQQQQPQPSTKAATKRWWHTFKYRPILGVVPLQATTTTMAETTSSYPPLEVALVERPGWDMDLPER